MLVQDRERPVLPGITDRVHDGNEHVGDDGVEVVVLHEATTTLRTAAPSRSRTWSKIMCRASLRSVREPSVGAITDMSSHRVSRGIREDSARDPRHSLGVLFRCVRASIAMTEPPRARAVSHRVAWCSLRSRSMGEASSRGEKASPIRAARTRGEFEDGGVRRPRTGARRGWPGNGPRRRGRGRWRRTRGHRRCWRWARSPHP